MDYMPRSKVYRYRTADSLFRIQLQDDPVMTPELIKSTRVTGALNLSRKGLSKVPEKVWGIDVLDEDEIRQLEVKMAPIDDSDDRWWEMIPLSVLDLSSNCLTQISSRIKNLYYLSTLNVQDNKLDNLPEELGELKRIEYLNLSKNSFHTLPRAIFQLSELRILLVAHNNLELVHEGISDLVMLQQLDMSHNNISPLPPGMGFLIRLTQLNLSHNKLKEIPPDLVNLRVLRELNMDHNELESLPPMGELRRMEIFSVVHNQLTAVPNFSGCEDLREVRLDFNKIKEMPADCIEGLVRLRVFNLRDNQLCCLPAEVSHLFRLAQFDLRNNSLTGVPPSLSLLPHLEVLRLDGNTLLDIRKETLRAGTPRVLDFLRRKLHEEGEVVDLPCLPSDASDFKFPNRYAMRNFNALNLATNELSDVPREVFKEAIEAEISVVDLSKNRLTQVPEGLQELTKQLRELNLSCNLLKSVSPTLGAFYNLQFLDLSNNGLTFLPEELGELERLRELNIAFNKFQELPSCIRTMTGLEILDVHDNQMCSVNPDVLINLKRLAVLNLCNNNISCVPPELGYLTHLRSLELSGNCFRQPRYSVLEKGTAEILSYLRNRIPL